jgi:hypothetical protein
LCVRMHNRKLPNIRPSGAFWPEITSEQSSRDKGCHIMLFLVKIAMSRIQQMILPGVNIKMYIVALDYYYYYILDGQA